MKSTRREFIQKTGCGLLSAAAIASGLDKFGAVSALAQGTGYRSLVCIFLAGGNDGNNMVIPLDGYGAYSGVRSSAGLAIAQAQLLPIQPASISSAFGLHPSLAALHPLFEARNLAVVCNVGPLVRPISRTEYQAGAPRPYQLFSHSDQIAQWQSSVSTGPSATGWGGRVADTFGPQPFGYPTITALAGGAFARGLTTAPLSVAPAPTTLPQVLALTFNTAGSPTTRRNTMDYVRTLDRSSILVAATETVTQQALDIARLFTTDPTLTTVFPNTSLGNQLKQVAKLIKFNRTISPAPLSRQIFFCSLGGFDTHSGQVATQANLLTQVSDAMRAFYDSTLELGIAKDVTAFTLSDFGRTLQPAGSGGTVGSDHAWGNHHLVVGGSVRGGDFYGVRGANGTVFPTLQLSGPDDTDTRGRWIPTSSVDQYAATLSRWLGVDSSQIPSVFPQITQFSPNYLGFLP